MHHDNSGPAFPRPGYVMSQDCEPEQWVNGNSGMSLRDWFAGMAMQGQLANIEDPNPGPIAAASYELADEMLRERAKPATGNADAVIAEKRVLQEACNAMVDALSKISRMVTVDFEEGPHTGSQPLRAFQAARRTAQAVLEQIPVGLMKRTVTHLTNPGEA